MGKRGNDDDDYTFLHCLHMFQLLQSFLRKNAYNYILKAIIILTLDELK